MAKEKTEDEIREEFLTHVRVMVDYWEHQVEDKTLTERLDGLAFSLLVTIDGGTGLGKFILAPDPHPDDKQYCIENEEDYRPENHKSNVKCDISGSLHELYHKK